MQYEVTVTGDNTIAVDLAAVGQQGVRGINYITGGWVVSTAYAASDSLAYNGVTYICILAHTSTAADEPGIGVNTATYWEVLAARGGDGSVTSVGITGGTGITSTGGPITSNGAITVALDSATQTSLGLADSATQPSDNVSTLTNDAGYIPTSDIGSVVQAYDAGLLSIAGLTTAADKMVYTTASDVYAVTTITTFGRSLVDDADAATARTTLGLGTAATTASTAYATAAQGTLADSAIQPSDNISTLTNDSGYLTTLATGDLSDWPVDVSVTEVGYLDGVTSAIQTQLNSRVTLTGAQTLTDKTLTAPTIIGTVVEDVYAISGTTPALEPANGSIQTWTLTANSTPTDALVAGEGITLMVNDGISYTITWPTTTWVNNGGLAPTLATSGYTVIALWKVSTTLYGALVGDGS